MRIKVNNNDKKQAMYKLFKLKIKNLDIPTYIKEYNSETSKNSFVMNYKKMFIDNKLHNEKIVGLYLIWNKNNIEFETGLGWLKQDEEIEVNYDISSNTNLSMKNVVEENDVNIDNAITDKVSASIFVQWNGENGVETFVFSFRGNDIFELKDIDINFPKEIYKKTNLDIVNGQEVVSPNDELSSSKSRTKGHAKSTIGNIGQYFSSVEFRADWRPYQRTEFKNGKTLKSNFAKRSLALESILSTRVRIDNHIHSGIKGNPQVSDLLLIIEFLMLDVIKRKNKNTNTKFISPITDEKEIIELWKFVIENHSNLEEKLVLNYAMVFEDDVSEVTNIVKNRKHNWDHHLIKTNFVLSEENMIDFLKTLSLRIPDDESDEESIVDSEEFILHYLILNKTKVDSKIYSSKNIPMCKLFDIWDLKYNGNNYYFWKGNWYLNSDNFISEAKEVIQFAINEGKVIHNNEFDWHENWDEEHFNKVVSLSKSSEDSYYLLDRRLFGAKDKIRFEIADLLLNSESPELIAVKGYKTLGSNYYVFEQSKLSVNQWSYIDMISDVIGNKIKKYSIWIYIDSGNINPMIVKSPSFLIGMATFIQLMLSKNLDYEIVIRTKVNDQGVTKDSIGKKYIKWDLNKTTTKSKKFNEIINKLKEI